MYFDHGDDQVYPKEIDIPYIEFIQYPEPHVLVTDWYENPQSWYSIYTLIEPFAEQAFLCYNNGYWHASIACAINCCETILKYEYLRRANKTDAMDLIENRKFSLGYFTGDNSKNLKKLRIKKKLQSKLNYLNSVRIGLYHFNPKKIRKINRGGKTDIEREANPITDELAIPITAYKVYSIMQELISNFYNKKMQVKYLKEGLKDARRNMKAEYPKYKKQFNGLPPSPQHLIGSYMKKKYEHLNNEIKKLSRRI
jgi:hypothetical protein